MTIEDISSWPALVGSTKDNIAPPRTEISCGESEDPHNPEWEMLVDDDDEIVNVDTMTATVTSSIFDDASFIFPDAANNETLHMNTTATTPAPLAFVRHNTRDSNKSNRGVEGQRPRSYTVGGGGGVNEEKATNTFFHRAASGPIRGFTTTAGATSLFPKQRTSLLRKCSSTPDLLICDDDHDIIIDDISDDSEDEEETSEEEDAELVEHGGEDNNNESFEVLSNKAMNEEDEFTEVRVEEEDDDYSEIAPPSINTSSCWSLTSTLLPHPSSAASVAWGCTTSGPTFKDVLLARQRFNSSDEGEFGKDKALTEAKLLDPNRRNHHLRIRIKPKLVVVGDDGGSSNSHGTKTMKHAHSTGGLSKMLHDVGEGHDSSFGQGGQNRRVKKKQSLTITEEDEICDFFIGRGSGGGGTVIGESDAMDYYQRKEHGSKSAVNKKKERPDEAKRREIIMYKKNLQRLKQAESQKGQKVESSSTKEMTKNDKGVGGKKEKRRL